MWKKYFKVTKIVPGRVIIHGYGTIDFSRDDLPLELVKNLYEDDCRYLKITEEGKRVIYNIMPHPVDKTPVKPSASLTAPARTGKKEIPAEKTQSSEPESKNSHPRARRKKKGKKTVSPKNSE